MQKKFLIIGLVSLLAARLNVNAQHSKQDSTYKKWFVGSSFLRLGNFIPDDPNPPKYIPLNVGHQITPGKIVKVRLKKSPFPWPLGIPFDPDFDATGLNYPGYERVLTPQIGNQHFWWKKLYPSISVWNGFEKFVDKNEKKIEYVFTLNSDFYTGCRFKFFKDRFFIEPSTGESYWPLGTGKPNSLKAQEQRLPNFINQSGLDVGLNSFWIV